MLIAAWIFSAGTEEKGLGPVVDLLGWGLCVQVAVRSGALEHLEVGQVGGGGGAREIVRVRSIRLYVRGPTEFCKEGQLLFQVDGEHEDRTGRPGLGSHHL